MSSTSTRPNSRPKGMRGNAKFLRRQLLALLGHFYAALQRSRRLLQQLPLPRPADQPAFAGAKIILRESDQGRQSAPASRPHVWRKSAKPRPRLPPRPLADRPESRSILLRTSQTGAAPSCIDFLRSPHPRATARDRLPRRGPGRDARPPARPDRRSRECRRCRSPSPDSRRDRAAPR